MPIRIEFTEVKSQNIKAIGHDLVHGLFVDFHSGRRYRYAGVPAEIHDALLKESNRKDGSVGKVFNRLVKAAGYEFEEVEVGG
jgi:hypothetical protein